MDSKEITARVCAAVVGATLALAGAGKVTSWNQWRANARQQHLWTAVAVAVPALELFLGAALLVLKPAATILGLATLLLVVFTSFLALQVTTKSQVPCACFGAHVNRPPSWRDVARNLGLIALMFAAAAFS
ncbi:MAG: MauE/DoxX family redox-associated membrane protein [Ilumatobacteraceae bacterium]